MHALQHYPAFMINFMNERMLFQLRLGYDIGKGYVTCEEDVANKLEDFIESPLIRIQYRDMLQSTRHILMKELGNK